MEVIEQFNKGESVFLELIKKEDSLLLLKDGELAGIVDEKEYPNTSKLSEINIIKDILEKHNSIEVKVSNSQTTTYFVNVPIKMSLLNQAKQNSQKEHIKEMKGNLIKKGFKEDTLNNIEDYLLKNGLEAQDIENIFATYKVYQKEVSWRIPSKPETMFKDTFQALLTAECAISNQFHLLCSGEKGTGKNVFIETLAYVYQRPLYSISINRETDKYDLMGSKTIDVEENPDGTSKNTVKFSPEILLEAMEIGGILNIDEINFADPGVTGLLHSIGDERRAIEVPGYKYVKADDNFIIMATMNNNYQGTNQLNEALQDRFVDIIFPNNFSIFEILEEKCGDVKKADLQKADKLYQKMLSIVRDRESLLDENCITIRGFIQACKMSNRLGLKKSLEICVAHKVKDQEYQDNIKELIDNLIN